MLNAVELAHRNDHGCSVNYKPSNHCNFNTHRAATHTTRANNQRWEMWEALDWTQSFKTSQKKKKDQLKMGGTMNANGDIARVDRIACFCGSGVCVWSNWWHTALACDLCCQGLIGRERRGPKLHRGRWHVIHLFSRFTIPLFGSHDLTPSTSTMSPWESFYVFPFFFFLFFLIANKMHLKKRGYCGALMKASFNFTHFPTSCLKCMKAIKC